jgi:hypothetical protein
MVVLVVFSMLLGGVFMTLSLSRTSLQTGDAQITVQGEARKAIDKLSREIRQAASVNLDAAYPFNVWGEKIRYRVVNNQLIREVEGGASSVIANNISSVQFSVSGGNVVNVTVAAQKSTIFGRQLNAAVSSEVTLRN